MLALNYAEVAAPSGGRRSRSQFRAAHNSHATRPEQQIRWTNIAALCDEQKLPAPAVVIVGKLARIVANACAWPLFHNIHGGRRQFLFDRTASDVGSSESVAPAGWRAKLWRTEFASRDRASTRRAALSHSQRRHVDRECSCRRNFAPSPKFLRLRREKTSYNTCDAARRSVREKPAAAPRRRLP